MGAVWFVGVSTAGSLVHRAMARWRPLLGGDLEVRGRDLPLDAPEGAYRSLLDDLPSGAPGPEDLMDLRRVLYGLHAILRLHFAQEEEAYAWLSSGEESVSVA